MDDNRCRMEKQEREKEMLKKFVDARRKIWGFDACECKIVYNSDTGLFYAECEGVGRRLLKEDNYEDKLNDLFWYYCMRNVDGMAGSPT